MVKLVVMFSTFQYKFYKDNYLKNLFQGFNGNKRFRNPLNTICLFITVVSVRGYACLEAVDSPTQTVVTKKYFQFLTGLL
jgi:hypothetical protein